MPYFVEMTDGTIEKYEGDFDAQNFNDDGAEAVYTVGRTYKMQRTLLPVGGKAKGAPRRYSLPDGSRKLRSEMTEAEIEWLNAKIKKARDARGKKEE